MNFCSKVAWTIIRNAISKERTTDNAVVSPLGFNLVLNMVVQNLTGPTSHLLQINKNTAAAAAAESDPAPPFNKNTAAAAASESDPAPPKARADVKMRRGEDGFTLRCAIKALYDKEFPLQPSFHQLVTQRYRATVDEVDFQFGDRRAIVVSVNSWMKKQTEGLLSKIIDNDDVDSLMRLLFVNTHYFKAKWSDPFDPDLTEDGDFHLLDGKTVKVPFMTGCKRYHHRKLDNLDLITIPYYPNGDVSMNIFLPNETQEFQQFLHKIGLENILDQDFKLKRPSDRDLLIPKFDIQYNTAGFPDVVSDDGLFLGKILQNSVIKVDEAGTEAATATCLSMCGASPPLPPPSPPPPPPPPPPIVVDRPFMFMIREENCKMILFLGAVTNPLT